MIALTWDDIMAFRVFRIDNVGMHLGSDNIWHMAHVWFEGYVHVFFYGRYLFGFTK